VLNRLPFYIVDVFAEARYTGNQLAVFRGNPSSETMQQIAREMNFAETTFITSATPRDGGYDVRIFMPTLEAPFAGHPTLGTAYIIQREVIGQPVDQVILNLKVGQIPVTFADDGVLWMQQKPPVFGHNFSHAAVADVLTLQPDDIDARFPVQEVSTGLPFVIVPLKTLETLKRARIDAEKLTALLRGKEAGALLLFCPETHHRDNHLHVRVPEDIYHLAEDAATGSANGCLAAYLVQQRYFDSDQLDVRVEQGYILNRPSLLLLRAAQTKDHIDVRVGGKVVMIAQGEWAV
jgi:trans-2,3-dihydro-3-hydroxyanthranilate isomerase